MMKTTIDKEIGTTATLKPDPRPEEVAKGGDSAGVNVDRVTPLAENTTQAPKVGCPVEAFYY